MKDYPHCDKIHTWFSLTYCAYQVVPRLLLDDCPEHIQDKFIEVMDYIEEHYDNTTFISKYMVRGKDSDGKFVTDPLSDYRHGDARQYRIDPYASEAPQDEEPEECDHCGTPNHACTYYDGYFFCDDDCKKEYEEDHKDD